MVVAIYFYRNVEVRQQAIESATTQQVQGV